MMNLLLPFLLMTIAFAIPHAVGLEGVKVGSISADSPAALAGLKADDVLLTANGQELITIADFGEILNETPDAPLVLGIERDGVEQEITVNPPYIEDGGLSKAGVGLTSATVVTESLSGWQAISTGFADTGRMYVAFGGLVADLFTGDADFGGVVGPIGVADATAEIVPYGASVILMWAASISMAIGIANLLPIPVFDGGHILFVLIEMARKGKRMSMKWRMGAQMVGLVLILSLFVVVGYRDIERLITGGSLLP
jgi:regulator of sigma E protease